MDTKLTGLGETCVECKIGVYRPTSEAPAIPIKNAGVKKLSRIAGYVVLLVAFAWIIVGLIEQEGAFLYQGGMLAFLALIMIRWGTPAKKSTSDLLCNKCGAAPPAQVVTPVGVARETAPVASKRPAEAVVQESGSAKTEPIEDSEFVRVTGPCGVCSTELEAIFVPTEVFVDHIVWGARWGGSCCPACGVIYCDPCKKELGFSWLRGGWKNAKCKSCGASMLLTDGSTTSDEEIDIKLFVLADNWVQTIQKKLADPKLDAKLADIERRRAKRERKK